jgi:hypothetical protein
MMRLPKVVGVPLAGALQLFLFSACFEFPLNSCFLVILYSRLFSSTAGVA